MDSAYGQTKYEGHGLPERDFDDNRPEILLPPEAITAVNTIVAEAMAEFYKQSIILRIVE